MNKRGILAIAALITITLLLLIIPLATTQNQSGDVGTTLEVGSVLVPPSLVSNIPDQTWPKNTNNTNAFKLDDYFVDNETITYNNTDVENITIVITQNVTSTTNETTNETTNTTENWASFYPDADFSGVKTVIFTATDIHNLSTDSNTVTLNVTTDDEAPLWFNPTKDQTQIYQNTIVNFSATWTDNVGLKNYELEIDQGSGFSSQETLSFSGTEAVSSQRIQISAAGGTEVRWRFYATDLSGNQNVTDIQNFTVLDSTPPSSDGGSSSSGGGGATGNAVSGAEDQQTETVEDFSIDPAEAFLIQTKQGAANTITFKVTNTGSKNLTFTVTMRGFEEFTIAISESSFILAPGDSKTVVIEINVPRFITPDMYFGEIEVATATSSQKIPVTIVVKPFTSDIDVTVNISDDYKRVSPGEEVVANITITNIGDIEEQPAAIYYAITNFFGGTLDAQQEELLFNRKAITITRNLTTTKDTPRGEYIFFARAVVGKNISVGIDTFEVGDRFNLAAFIRTNLIIILIALFLISSILFIIRYRHNKERLHLLGLYLMINEMKALIKENKTEQAITLYIRIKQIYGEPVSRTVLHNKEKLKQEMNKLASRIDKLMEQHKIQKAPPEEKKDKKDGDKTQSKEKSKTADDKKSSEEKAAPAEKPAAEEKQEEKKETPKPAPKEKPAAEKPETKKQEAKPAAEKKEAPKKEVKTVVKKPAPEKKAAPAKKEISKKALPVKEAIEKKQTPEKPEPKPTPSKEKPPIKQKQPEQKQTPKTKNEQPEKK